MPPTSLAAKDLAKDSAMNDKTNVSPGRKKIKGMIFQHQTINSPPDMSSKKYHMVLLVAEGDIILS
jgi:hypothetical protein